MILSLVIDITVLEYYFSNYYLFVIVRYDIDILRILEAEG